MIPDALKDILSHDPHIMSGAICFAGTRVPVQALLDTFDDGDSLETFLTGFPDVTRQQAHAFLHWEQNEARRVLGVQAAE